MTKLSIKATSFKTTIGIVVFFLVSGSGAGFYYAQTSLDQYANQINSDYPNFNTSNSETQRLKDSIAKYQPAATEADKLAATNQSQIAQLIKNLASNNHISISDPVFNKSNSATITLQNPTNFTNLVKFLKAIEGSSPKMQIINLQIDRINNSTDTVNVQPLNIEFYPK